MASALRSGRTRGVVEGAKDNISAGEMASELREVTSSGNAGILRLLALLGGLVCEVSFFARLTPRGLELGLRPLFDLDPV